MFKTFADYQSAEVLAKIREYDTVAEMWADCVAKYANDPAIDFAGVTHTFAELETDAAKFRTVLCEAGIRIGDRVCLMSPNSYDFVKAYIAAVTLGITVAILPPQLDREGVFGCSKMFSAHAVLYAAEFEDKMSALRSRGGCRCIGVETEGGAATPASGEVKGGDGCVIMFTGGTTGRSKGALLSNAAVMQGTVNGCYGYDDVFGQRYMLVLPLSHVFGLIRNLMTSLYTGSCLFICQNNKDMFRDIAAFRPTILVLVPALAEMALNLSRQFGRNMLGDNMKTIICGAAAVPPYLIREYDKLGVKLCPGYGLTESANLVSGNPDNVGRPDSVGLLYPHQEYRVVDGELQLKGRNMMDGYVGDPAANDGAYTDGWFRTGDLVRFDDDGFLYITGRIKEIIVLANGENVSPADVERHFNALPEVQDSQIFEDVDDGGRHFLALEVVPRMSELKKCGEEDLIAFLTRRLNEVNDSLPSYQRAARITVRDSDFPRTPSMKIARYHKV